MGDNFVPTFDKDEDDFVEWCDECSGTRWPIDKHESHCSLNPENVAKVIVQKMIKVELWDLQNFMGVIVPCQSGVIFSNQTGGIDCFHPEVEGVYIPPPYFGKEPDCLYDYWLDEYDAEIAKQAIKELDSEDFEALEESDFDMGEAWIPVKVKDHQCLPQQLKPFIGKVVILTYQNSD
jgi:hypothetical protein